ncbi:MAG: sulfotransferase domain-containing protein [Paracoccaceae bacterium]|nr:sulfotransferase domain-containing protein [Paracoccaceae bacterium]
MEQFSLEDLPLRHYQHPVWDSGRWAGFEPRPGDILVCTPYKAGTTWMQMICALLIFQRTEIDHPLAEISPWMDLKGHDAADVHATYAAQTHRRFIKTHTPLDGLPWYPQARYICVQRDPRDVFMSLLNHLQNWNPESRALFAQAMRDSGAEKPTVPDDPNAFFREWLTDGSFDWEEDGAPYWSVFRHGLTYWLHRDRPNIELVHYADLKRNLEAGMRRIAEFLEIEVPDGTWPRLVEAARFENMKKNADRTAPDTDMNMWKDNSQFFNKGTSGQWQGVLDSDSLALLEQVTAKYPAAYIDWLFNGSGGDA